MEIVIFTGFFLLAAAAGLACWKYFQLKRDVYAYTQKHEKTYDTKTEKQVMSFLEQSPYRNDLYTESLYESMKTIQEAQGNMMEIGTVIALLLLLVGVLNYVNTIAGSIQNRRLTFSVMESVGMSGKQLRRLLMREGMLYGVFSVLITGTAGSVITYVCFQSMNYMGIPFQIPGVPLAAAAALVLLICVIAPLISYQRLAGKRSVAERLRDYE